MPARRGGAAPAVVEVRRGVLEIGAGVPRGPVDAILQAIPHTADNELVYLSRENADRALQALGAAGLAVLSLAMEVQALPSPAPSRPAHAYFNHYRIPSGLGFTPSQAAWRRYSFSSRRLLAAVPRRMPGGGWSLFLREGQPAAALDNGKLLGYFLPAGEELARCSTPQEMLEICHWQSLPASVYFDLQRLPRPYVALYHTPIWLPPKHYDLLYKRLIGMAGKGSGEFVLIHELDLPLARQILGTLGIELAEGTPPLQANTAALAAVETAANAVQQAYSLYLKSEEGIGELEAIGRERRWDQVADPAFKQLLAGLSTRAYNFEPLAEELLTYLLDRLPRSFDWKTLRGGGAGNWLLEGVVLDAESLPRFGPGGSKYYKVIVQDFGLVLGVMTKRALGGGSRGQPAYLLANNWRATPYAGRLKLTGAGSSVAAERVTGQLAAEEGYSYIYGIPSVEAQLAQDLYLAAFFLDRDSKYWRGHNEFSRYFAGHGKLIEKMVADFDEPAALLQDMFGRYFYLKFGPDNYTWHQQFIQATALGRWKRFVAHAGLRSLLQAESGLPAFDLSPGSVPRDVGHQEVAEGAVLGLLRYYGQLSRTELLERLQTPLEPASLIEAALGRLASRGRLVSAGDTLYYNYPFCAPQDRVWLASPDTLQKASPAVALFFAGLRPFLPMIHPLGYGSPLAHPPAAGSEAAYQQARLQRADRYATIVTRRTQQAAANWAAEAMKRYGVAVLRAHPWNMDCAADIIRAIRAGLPLYEVIVQRRDVLQLYEGREVEEAWLRLYAPDIIARLHLAERLRQSGIASRVTVKI